MKIVRAAAALVRLDTSFAGFLSIWLPVLSRTKNIRASTIAALPLFFISFCTFIANDMTDMERDRVNHPERPLVRGDIAPELAATLYFVCLFIALITIRFLVPFSAAFLYYLLLTLSASYMHIVERLPAVKAPYVAGAIALPVIIIVTYFPAETHLYVIAFAVFLFCLGKEMCMDLEDRPGDTASFMHRIARNRIAGVAFTSQATALLLLLTQVRRYYDVIAFTLLTVLLARAQRSWFAENQPTKALALMKLQLLCGLYFVC